METPPIQFTMEDHSNLVLTSKSRYMKLMGAAVLACCFAAGLVFSFAVVKPEPEIVQPSALSAAVAEALAAQSAFSTVAIIGQGAIVKDIDTGAVLYAHNADSQLPLASLTKVPLVLAVSEVLDPETIVTIPTDTSYNSKATPLYAGEKLYAKDLISYTLVASSNDGAQILADIADEPLRARYALATSPAAVWRMNDISRELGLRSTYFLNPTGLDESETQSGAYGSARDMATLFAYALSHDPHLFSDTATTSIQILSLDGHVAKASNTDQVLDSMPGIIMGKTGYTDLAGGNLVVVFFSHGKHYVAAVLGSTEEGRFSDIRQLMMATESAASQ